MEPIPHEPRRVDRDHRPASMRQASILDPPDHDHVGERNAAVARAVVPVHRWRDTELHAAMRPSLMRAVEALTARRVLACMSDTDVGAQTSPVVFVLDRPLDLDKAHWAIEQQRRARAAGEGAGQAQPRIAAS